VSNTYKKRKHHVIFSMYFLLFGALVAIFTSTVNYNIEYTNIENEISGRAEWTKQSKDEMVRVFLEETEDQVWALATNPLTDIYNQNSTEKNRKNLESLFFAAATANRTFMQVRLLGPLGKERVRIDRPKGINQPKVIDQQSLQDKSSRYYFAETSKIPYGQFWHSKMDLNRERGKIEQPIRPTFRVATPIFHENKFAGVVLINIEISQLLQVLGASSEFDIYIADQDGGFIVHPDKALAWGQYLEGRANVLTQFPKLGPEIMKQTVSESTSYFTYPFLERIKNREHLRLVLLPKEKIMEELQYNNFLTAAMIAALVVFISIPLSWLVALGPSRLQNSLYKALEENRRHKAIIDRNVITSTTDADGVIKSISHAFLEAAGRQSDEMVGHRHNIIKHPETPKAVHEELWNTITQGKPWRGEIRNQRSDGKPYWLETVITPELSSTGEIFGYMSVSQDISDKKEIQRLSVTDQLTSLYNRRHLDNVLDSEISRFNRYGGSLCLIICDIDHFKSVNDELGHQTGDKVLVEFARILRDAIRKTDCVGRWGGEEFAPKQRQKM